MTQSRSSRLRPAMVFAGTIALLAAAGIACGTVLAIDEPSGDAQVDGAVTADGSSSDRDAAGSADVGEALPGTDGAADDGAPIAVDASLDGYTPGCPGNENCARVVFVTSVGLPMSSASQGVADMQCVTLAKGSSALPRIKGRQFLAWISDGVGTDPASRFAKGTGPYIRPDGTVIAVNWTDLTNGSLQNSIFHDETGKGVAAAAHVWTGTAADGTFLAPNCAGWTNTEEMSRIGVIGATTPNWTSFGTADPCTASLRVYCFEK